MLDWLIIGGGIHGTHLSFHLTRVKRISAERIRVLDPFEQPLALWRHQAENCGMAFMRSPHVQNLDHDPLSISTFVKTHMGKGLAHFIPIHNRPSLPLFLAHSEWLIQHHKLDRLRVQGRANKLERIEGGWRVETGNGGLEARRIILAMGATEQPRWPEWATELKNNGAPIDHVFDSHFQRTALRDWSRAIVVGGGITGAQTALTLAEQLPGQVTLLMRHPLRIHHFDSDLCWIGPICLNDFHREQDYNRRREMIHAARYPGSIPPDVQQQLQNAIQVGRLKLQIGEVSEGNFTSGLVRLKLQDEASLQADRVILATGFDTARPGGVWLDEAIANYGLATAECGYPIVDSALCWDNGLHVTGPLAELEVGAVARNLIGARLAAGRIGAVVD